MLIGLGLALLLGAVVAGVWWFQSGDDRDTAAVADDESVADGDSADAEPVIEGGADGSGGADGTGGGSDGPLSPADAGLDPITGEAYPGFLDLLSFADFRDNSYPHGILADDGTVTFRGRIGSQEEVDTAVAEMEGIVGAGNVTEEFELTPGFPSYTTGLVFLEQTVLFESNSTDIDPSYFPFLDNLVATLNQRPEMRVTAIGHADSAGALDVNIRISRERAQSVFSYLVDRGVSSLQVSTESRGETGGTDDEELEQDSAEDRRVEFVVDFDVGS